MIENIDQQAFSFHVKEERAFNCLFFYLKTLKIDITIIIMVISIFITIINRTVGSGNILPSVMYRGLSESYVLVLTQGQFDKGQNHLLISILRIPEHDVFCCLIFLITVH